MPTFEYIARTGRGEKTTGVLEAATEAAAARMLDEQRLFPVRISSQEAAGGKGGAGGIKARDLAVFFEQLADLLRSGVPMMRSLETLGRTSSNKRMAAVVTAIQQRVAAGKSLSEAMGEQPGVFNTLQVAMVKAGERGGFLENVLADLAHYLERQDELRSRVQGAMIYPALLMMLGLGAMAICLLWLVPKFKPLFEGKPLPLPSRILFSLSDLLVKQWAPTLAVGMLVALGLAGFFGTASGRQAWGYWQLRIPVIGRTILMVALTRFCRILGTMLASGVPILQALQISKDATGCAPLGRAIATAADSVRQGQGLTRPLRKSGMVPEQILEMMAVAEESNQLEKVLLKVADTVERRTNQQVDQAVRLLEPVILIVLAIAILFVAMGVLYPIFTMARTIR